MCPFVTKLLFLLGSISCTEETLLAHLVLRIFLWPWACKLLLTLVFDAAILLFKIKAKDRFNTVESFSPSSCLAAVDGKEIQPLTGDTYILPIHGFSWVVLLPQTWKSINKTPQWFFPTLLCYSLSLEKGKELDWILGSCFCASLILCL